MVMNLYLKLYLKIIHNYT